VDDLTRFEPGADIHAPTGGSSEHIAHDGLDVIDAASPWHPKELSCRDDIGARVTSRWKDISAGRVEMGD
jgi:hypothetical protein